MSDAKGEQAASRREQIRVRIERLRRSRQRSSILGVPEIVGLAASVLLLLAVVFAYLYFLVPARKRLDDALIERDRLQRLILTSTEGVRRSNDTQTTLAQITESLQDFEMNHLARRTSGRLELLDRLNQLIKANNLRNTAGPTYTPLEAIDPNAPKTSQNRTGEAKLQTVYPGIGVSVTVEGQYPNLRKFLRDIEASNQFIVINGIELESLIQTNSPAGSATGYNAAGEEAGAQSAAGLTPQAARSAAVSLRVNMAAYFQREAAASGGETSSATP